MNQNQESESEFSCQDNFDLVVYYLYLQNENLSDEELESIDKLCEWIEKACLQVQDQTKLEYLQTEKICKVYQG